MYRSMFSWPRHWLEVSSQLHAPAALPQEKDPPPPDTHWIGSWVDPRTGLDDVEERKFLTLPGLELRSLGRPVRTQSLNRVCYPGSDYICNKKLQILHFLCLTANLTENTEIHYDI
jgi:hypothetical protein